MPAREGTVWTEEMTSRLVAMRKAGLKNDQIAAGLGVNPGELQNRISELIRSGEIASRRGLLWAHPDSYVEGRERTLETVTGDVGQLYQAGKTHKEIATELRLTENQVHNILTTLFAVGMPKRRRVLTDDQTRAIHNAYMAGGSIDTLAKEIGFSGFAVRTRMHKLGLYIRTRKVGTRQRPISIVLDSEHGDGVPSG